MLDPLTAVRYLLRARGVGRVMRTARLASLAYAALCAAGCGDTDGLDGDSAAGAAVAGTAGAIGTGGARTGASGPAAAATGVPDAQTTAKSPALDTERAALLARGEVLSFSCRPCHGLAPGDESPVGPHLRGMFGRPAAQLEGFEYSSALRQSGIVWTAETLDAWLAKPESFLPGNDMEFAGFRSAEDRRALIEYLRTRTAAGEGAEAARHLERASD